FARSGTASIAAGGVVAATRSGGGAGVAAAATGASLAGAIGPTTVGEGCSRGSGGGVTRAWGAGRRGTTATGSSPRPTTGGRAFSGFDGGALTLATGGGSAAPRVRSTYSERSPVTAATSAAAMPSH